LEAPNPETIGGGEKQEEVKLVAARACHLLHTWGSQAGDAAIKRVEKTGKKRGCWWGWHKDLSWERW